MAPIDPDERLSRYVDETGKYSVPENRVKHGAFVPTKKLKTSVFRTAALREEAVWEIGATYVEPKRGKRILARGDLQARVPLRIGLRVVPDEPPTRHANIEGWLDDGSDETNSLIKMRALQLAAEATLVVRPAPPGEGPQ